MSSKSDLLPPAADLSQVRWRPLPARYAYLAVLGVYAAVYGPSAADVARFLYVYGVLPRRWAHDVVALLYNGSVRLPLGGVIVAVALAAVLVARRSDLPGGLRLTRRGRATALVVLVVPLLLAIWGLRQEDAVGGSGDLPLYMLQLGASLVLAGVLAVALRGPGWAEVGLGRRRGRRDTTQFHCVVSFSLIGLGVSWIAIVETVDWFNPPQVVTDPLGPGVVEPGWYWLLVYLLNAAVEEGVCIAWLVAALRRAGRPRWEIYALAIAFRVFFHLYKGLAGLCAVPFVLMNVALFDRTRRLMPLILAHAVYDWLTANPYPKTQLVLLGACATAILMPPGTLSAIKRFFTSDPVDYSHLDEEPQQAPVPAPRFPAADPSSIRIVMTAATPPMHDPVSDISRGDVDG
jgi:hypothetical protein